MRINSLVFMLLSGLFVVLAGCGGSQTPVDCMADADKALFTDKDYAKASTLYQGIVDWKKEGEKPTEEQRFEACQKLIRCTVGSKKFTEVKPALEEMKEQFTDKVTFKHFATILAELIQAKAIDDAIDVIGLAKECFPKDKALLDEKVEQLKKSKLSNEQLEKLKTLGYL